MNLHLKNKTAFISGSTSGIGFATAKILLQEGAQVIINGRSQEGVDLALTKLIQLVPGSKPLGYSADFINPSKVDALIKKLPNIDILINNVGVYTAQSFFETTDKDWQSQFEINVMSGVRLSKVFLPKMLQNKWGRIIFLSSECANLVPDNLIAYSMTKAAILAVSRGLAQLTKGSNVTVNTVVPGSTLSEGALKFIESQAAQENKSKELIESQFFKNIRPSSLLQRFATVDEIANTISYLASPLSSATNGASIKIDGGSSGGII